MKALPAPGSREPIRRCYATDGKLAYLGEVLDKNNQVIFTDPKLDQIRQERTEAAWKAAQEAHKEMWRNIRIPYEGNIGGTWK